MKFKNTILSIFALACIGLIANAQEDDSWKLLGKKDTSMNRHSEKQLLSTEQKDDSLRKPGKITIHQDERIDDLIRTFDAADKKLEGNRIQIFLGKTKEAQKVRTAFVSKYPDIPAYATWQPPNMKVRIGDLKTRLDAERVLRMIRKDFPGAYIVKDYIELPDLDSPALEAGKAER